MFILFNIINVNTIFNTNNNIQICQFEFFNIRVNTQKQFHVIFVFKMIVFNNEQSIHFSSSNYILITKLQESYMIILSIKMIIII